MEAIETIIIGRRSCNDVARSIAEFNDNACHCVFFRVGDTVAVIIKPDVVANFDVRNAAVCLEVANTGSLFEGTYI